ncbi:hypothetical protein [Streptomyces sp. HB2AG]|uniref:hypothetical protein n=1 Tax=Streptomyces sp. HB2AG TaxID=2983400 RepID=UPI0022AB3B63|nr:hypothetical protein [Streptomyces sp. HB2AG]MCZ2526925.1 hypothetical protein [Streptomyces sp. HB2AG]
MSLGRDELERRRFLTTAAYSVGALALPPERRAEAAERASRAARGALVGAAEIEVVRDVTSAFSRADERLGGSTGRAAVVQYLVSDVASYCQGRFADSDTRRSMFGAAAELAYLAGWKAHDAGQDGLAQRYYLRSYRLAEVADPDAHAGYVLRILAHQAFDTGHGGAAECVPLAEAAHRRMRGRVGPETETLVHLTLARAHAHRGEARPAVAAIARAERLLDRARPDRAPRWAGLGGPAEARLTNQAGKALQALGDLRAAEAQFQRSARCWDPVAYPRIHALTLADLAVVQSARGLVEEACENWGGALDRMEGVDSARTRKAVEDMRSRLAVFRHRGPAAAQALDARAAHWQATHPRTP